jgi:hypothetical protein
MLSKDDSDASAAATIGTRSVDDGVASRCDVSQTGVITRNVPRLGKRQDIERTFRDRRMYGIGFIANRLSVQPSDC